MLFTTPGLLFSGLFSLVFIFTSNKLRVAKGELLPFLQPGPIRSAQSRALLSCPEDLRPAVYFASRHVRSAANLSLFRDAKGRRN